MKQSTPRVLNEQVVVAANNLNTIKRHQPRTLISSSQYLDSCGGCGGHSSSSSTSSCCSSTSNSTSGFASTSSILSDHQQQLKQQQHQQLPIQQAASVSPGGGSGGGGLSKTSVLSSRQQQRRRSWLSGSLGHTTNTTTTTSCGPLTTSQEDDEEEQEDQEEETPRSTPFSLASSTPTQQQSPSSFLLGAAYSGTILEEDAGSVSAARSPDTRGLESSDGPNNEGETNWLLAGNSASSSSSSSSNEEDDDAGDDASDILASTSCSESSSSTRTTPKHKHDGKRKSHHGNAKRKKRHGRRAYFWRLVASSTSGDSSSSDGHSTTTSGDDDEQENCDSKICDNLEADERRRATSSCPLQDLFEFSQESNPNNRPRLVLASPAHFLGNQLWHQQQQQHEFATATSSPQLLTAAAVHHPPLARLNSIHEDNHEMDQQQQQATLADNDFKASRADNDDAPEGHNQDAPIRRGASATNTDDASESKQEDDEVSVGSNVEEEVELGQVNRGGDGDVHSDDGDDAQDDDDDDDDYFYDEELSFSHQRRLVGGVCSGRSAGVSSGRATFQRPSIPTVESPAMAQAQARPTAATPTTANDLIARLSAASGARPLLVWAPTARRTSCPVGQLTSFASWRQLWPALPPAATTIQPQTQQQLAQLCANCAQCSNQQATATNSPIQWSEQQQQPAGLATVKSSRTSLACSDYFSSFDQTDQPPTQLHISGTGQPPPATQSSFRRRLAAGASNPMQAASAGLHSNHALAELPPLELRRQSTITGFDHHRYTAPRSPSLCLPHTVVHHPVRSEQGGGRNNQHHLLTAANAGPSTSGLGLPPQMMNSNQQRLLLSPTHSTGGSSSPSPTGWHHQNAAALAAIAISQQQQQQLMHTMHQRQPNQQQPPAAVGRNQFGRNRLESLESDRGSSPSWSASTSSLRSSIGGGNSIYSALAFQQQQQQRKRSSGSICSTASSSGVHSLASTTSGPCPACQQLQATANKCQTRSGHLAQGSMKQPPAPMCSACAQQQPQCGAQILRQLREEALEGAKLGPLTTTNLHPFAATLRGPNSSFGPFAVGSSQQVGPNQRPLAAVNMGAGQQQQVSQTQSLAQQQQQQQEQAVYFFLCCCQRNGSKNDGDSAPSPTASQADDSGETVNRPPAGSQQHLRPQAQEPERRVSLVARPAIVGAPDAASPVAGTSASGPQQTRRRSVATATATATTADLGPIREGSKSLTSRDSASGQQQNQQQHEQPQGMAAGARSNQEQEPSKHGARQDEPKEEEEEKESRQIPKSAVDNNNQDDGDLCGQLSALLNQLDGYQRRGRQLGADERELLATLSQRMSSSACIAGGSAAQATEAGRAGPPLPPTSDMVASTDRANVMRYSTPNLLLSSNFELLLRQQDRRKQEQSDQATAEQEGGPPEATEAWFLSRSPTASGQGAGANSAPGATASRAQRGSRESIRLRALESIATAASGKVATAAATQQQQQGGATSADQQWQQRSDIQSGLPVVADGHLGPEVSAGSSTGQLKATQPGSQVLDQQTRQFAVASGSCQSASDGICKEQTFDETLPSVGQHRRPERDEAPVRNVEQRATDDDDANPIRRRQRDAERGPAQPGGSARSDATGQQQQQRAAPGEQVADGRAPVSSSPVAAAFIVHDKSMAQARYLYSTLTSNAGALLATGSGTSTQVVASSSASQAKPAPTSAPATANQQQAQNTQTGAATRSGPAAAASDANKSSAASRVAVSPTRPTGPQRKQAQFVAQQRERQLRELAQQRQQQQQQQQQQQSTLAAAGEGSKLIGPLALESSARARKTRTRQQGGGGGADEGSSGSDSDDDDGPGQSLEADEPKAADNEQQADDEQVGELTPAIIESVCEQRRRSSQSSQVGVGFEQQQQQQQQQLQPMSMDPEMHALWAQGADLDTGNGNFIQATRRRRSVHAIHQVQLHQALQQQQHQQQVVGCGGGVALKLGPASHLAHERRSQQQQLSAGDVPGTSGGRLASGAAAVDSSRKLKDKLRKLRSSSSIEETQYRAAHRSSTARARFVSDPSTGGGGGGSASGQLSSEPRASSKVEMDEAQAIEFDDELEAATAAAATDELNLEADTLKPSLVEEEEEEEDDEEEEVEEQAKLRDQEAEVAETEPDEERRVCLSNGELEYDLDELESSECMLANLFQWNYPIFDLAQQYGQSILSKLSYRIFYDSGFFESFKIPKRAFFNFFHALEEGYLDKPYHNRLHAADVLHAVYYLTSQPIGNFCQVPLDLIELYDNLLATTKPPSSNRLTRALEMSRRTTTTSVSPSLAGESNDAEQAAADDDDDDNLQGDEFVSNLHNHIVAIVVAAAAAAADSELPFGIMGANLTALEVMALYTAAAMHDFQHPGRTNSFLVATNSPLALLYNDRSVLENHHSAAAWALFYSGPGYDWLCNLEKDEFKRFRFMIIELILATDLMRHYELVSAFNKKLHNVGRHNIDWFCESDRLLVMEIIIKLADVNGPMKGHHLHCQWTDRIAMEFYEQGDEERARNLPVSLYMDRSDPRLPELQKSFINHLVGPLSHSYAAAGFFPKSSEPEMLASAGAIARAAIVATQSTDSDPDQQHHDNQEGDGEQPLPVQSESVYNQTKYWLIDNSQEGRKKLNKQFLECVQTMNLRDNFLYWDAKSREKQQQMQQNSRKLS